MSSDITAILWPCLSLYVDGSIPSWKGSKGIHYRCTKKVGGKDQSYIPYGWWDDSQRGSIYGCMSVIAKAAEFPVVQGVEELPGNRATIDNFRDVATKTLVKKSVNPKSIIVVCTDKPARMVVFHRKWTNEYP